MAAYQPPPSLLPLLNVTELSTVTKRYDHESTRIHLCSSSRLQLAVLGFYLLAYRAHSCCCHSNQCGKRLTMPEPRKWTQSLTNNSIRGASRDIGGPRQKGPGGPYIQNKPNCVDRKSVAWGLVRGFPTMLSLQFPNQRIQRGSHKKCNCCLSAVLWGGALSARGPRQVPALSNLLQQPWKVLKGKNTWLINMLVTFRYIIFYFNTMLQRGLLVSDIQTHIYIYISAVRMNFSAAPSTADWLSGTCLCI